MQWKNYYPIELQKPFLMQKLLATILFTLHFFSCSAGKISVNEINELLFDNNEIITGAEQIERYLPLLEGKRVAIATNHTALVRTKNGAYVHLVDTLLALNVDIKKIFSPEHGFRGKADAGERVYHSVDEETGLAIVSLYGSYRKPADQDLKDLDIIVFDMQDVGARFYTYISTMHYVMEAAAENNIPVLILDRPNPNGHIVDGPILQEEFKSFVGMHPVPVLHGMTIAEYALMINGEGWLKDGVECELKYITCKGYNKSKRYALPVRPSPNLPNMTSVYLYPSLCYFEGTLVSVGRGTDKPFQIFGFPEYPDKDFSFTPESMTGATNPPHKGKKCYGVDLTKMDMNELQNINKLDLSYLIHAYKKRPKDIPFFNNFFNLLAGNNELQKQIKAGLSEEEIRFSWQSDLNNFKELRSRYLIYPQF